MYANAINDNTGEDMIPMRGSKMGWGEKEMRRMRGEYNLCINITYYYNKKKKKKNL